MQATFSPRSHSNPLFRCLDVALSHPRNSPADNKPGFQSGGEASVRSCGWSLSGTENIIAFVINNENLIAEFNRLWKLTLWFPLWIFVFGPLAALSQACEMFSHLHALPWRNAKLGKKILDSSCLRWLLWPAVVLKATVLLSPARPLSVESSPPFS